MITGFDVVKECSNLRWDVELILDPSLRKSHATVCSLTLTVLVRFSMFGGSMELSIQAIAVLWGPSTATATTED